MVVNQYSKCIRDWYLKLDSIEKLLNCYALEREVELYILSTHRLNSDRRIARLRMD